MGEEASEVKKVEIPVLKQNPSKDFRKEVVERRGELVLLINDLGFFKAKKLAKSLGEKYNVSERMIYFDFDWIKGHMKPVDLREVKIDLRIGTSKAYSEALGLLISAKDNEEKIKAINAVINASKHYREELEAWGDKVKIADKHEINTSGPAVFNFVTKSAEEIKSGKSNQGTGNKSETAGNTGSSG
jgi:hypothetical protein